MSSQPQATVLADENSDAETESSFEFPVSDFGFRDQTDHSGEMIDERLQAPNVSGITVRLELADGSEMSASLFSITRFDVVISLDGSIAAPPPQGIRFSFDGQGFTSGLIEGVLHWHGHTQGKTLLGVFSAEESPPQLLAVRTDERRGEIRYPIDQRAIVRGEGYRQEGRVIDYSLNGIAIELSRPMQLDQRYEATLMVAGQMLKLPMLCCFSTHGNSGYVAGCGLRCLEGSLLACAALPKPADRTSLVSISPQFPTFNHVSGRGQGRSSESGSYDRIVDWINTVSENVDERLTDRPVVSRAAILILAAVLMGMSIQATGNIQIVTFLYSMFGIFAYIGLTQAANIRERLMSEETIRIKRELAERRLVASRTPRRSARNRIN